MQIHGNLNQTESDYLMALTNIVNTYEVDLNHLVVRQEPQLFGEESGVYLQIWYHDEVLLYTLNLRGSTPYILLDAEYITLLRDLRRLECYPGQVYEEPNTRVYLKKPNDLYHLSDHLLGVLDALFEPPNSRRSRR